MANLTPSSSFDNVRQLDPLVDNDHADTFNGTNQSLLNRTKYLYDKLFPSTSSNGKLLIGNGTDFTMANLTAGAGVSVTNGAGSVTLANTGVTSNVAGSGISVSGATGAVTITNAGVTSLTGTANQVVVSASTGGVTLSTPQDINTTSTPTFAGVNTPYSNASSGSFTVKTGGTTRQTWDASGHSAVGTTPSAWGSSWGRGFQVNRLSLAGDVNQGCYLFGNLYFNGSNIKHIDTGYGTEIGIYNGQVNYFGAPSAAADANATINTIVTYEGSLSTTTGWNGAASVMYVAANSTTSRSINAAGTINASGADYAEYEYNNGIKFAKGDIVGFLADGTLTDKFSAAVSFGIKSSDPCLVGGDDWCKGVKPIKKDAFGKPIDPKDVKRYNEEVETARQMVDRIAYCGKVPVNVYNAKPGCYIAATGGEDDTIEGVCVYRTTADSIENVVGLVRRILPDGRAEVKVL